MRQALRQSGRAGRAIESLLAPVTLLVEAFSGIEIPSTVEVGGGLRIYHGGNVVFHGDVVIGRNCTVLHGVTVGNRGPGTPAPVLGDDVGLLAYAQVLGGVVVGDGSRVGAMSVLMQDLPPGKIAVGIPARIL